MGIWLGEVDISEGVNIDVDEVMMRCFVYMIGF